MPRQYNASLYRLRRLHFCHKYQHRPHDWPSPNPWAAKPGDNPDPFSPPGFNQRIKEAQDNWNTITDNLSTYLETTGDGAFGFTLLAADMVAVNDYVMSMRIVVERTHKGGIHAKELGGSSSHVSLSSPFSSYSSP